MAHQSPLAPKQRRACNPSGRRRDGLVGGWKHLTWAMSAFPRPHTPVAESVGAGRGTQSQIMDKSRLTRLRAVCWIHPAVEETLA